MYYIKSDDLTLWSPIDSTLKIASPVLKLAVNKIGSLSFKIYPDHKYYDRLEKMKSIITVYQDARILFRGRIYSDNMDFHKTKKIEVEGVLGCLNDSLVRPYEFSGNIADFLIMLIDQHNAQVEPHQRLLVGNLDAGYPPVTPIAEVSEVPEVEIVESWNITTSSDTYPTTWAEIDEKVLKDKGGYISVRYEDDGTYIDYLADYSDTSTQPIAFAVNLLDLDLTQKVDTLSTCIIPRGENDSTGAPIDITSVNNGLDYVVDEDAVAKYGKIFETITFKNINTPLRLLERVNAYLRNRNNKLSSKLTVKALDLHLTDDRIEAFKLGDYIQVFSEPHGIDGVAMLTEYDIDLSNPSACTVTLGFETDSFVGNQAGSQTDNENRIDVVSKQLNDKSTQITNEVLSETLGYINESIENSEANTRSLLEEYVKVTDLETVREEMSTTVTQTAEDFTYRFDTLNERITEENGEIIRLLEENSKYIRLVDGSIILGEQGALLTTKITNGRISFLYNDSIEVAYISEQKLYITKAEILDSIVIGNFGFIPRANGNLSFKKVR